MDGLNLRTKMGPGDLMKFNMYGDLTHLFRETGSQMKINLEKSFTVDKPVFTLKSWQNHDTFR